MASIGSLKFGLLLPFSLAVLHFSSIYVHALNIGFHSKHNNTSVNRRDCSRKCESEFCGVPPFLRYGKFCGLKYSGCPGEEPCDGLDACCMKHDACIDGKNHTYISQECSHILLDCVQNFKGSGRATFKGNKCAVEEVTRVIKVAMEAALIAGRVFHKP